MTSITFKIKKAIEDVEDAQATLEFDMAKKHHSAMEYYNLLQYAEVLKNDKEKHETALKFMLKCEEGEG